MIEPSQLTAGASLICLIFLIGMHAKKTNMYAVYCKIEHQFESPLTFVDIMIENYMLYRINNSSLGFTFSMTALGAYEFKSVISYIYIL